MKFGRKDYNGRIVDNQNRIPQDEPVFLLRGQDELAPRLLLMWAMEVRLRGGDPNMAAEAEAHAQEMIRWQKNHKVKTPDMYQESEEKKLIYTKVKSILETNPSDIKNLIHWVGRYKDDDGNKFVKILMSFDLKPSSCTKSIDELGYDDFEISDEVELELHQADVIIYFGKSGTYKILKNNFK